MKYTGLEIRIQRKITQEELVKRANVSRTTISDLESGKKTDVKMSTLISIANALSCKVSDLFAQKI